MKLLKLVILSIKLERSQFPRFLDSRKPLVFDVEYFNFVNSRDCPLPNY